MIEYEDFSLKIEPKRGEVYPVIVLRSPAGEGRSSFTLPFDPNEIGDILFDLGRTVRSGGGTPRREVSPAATSTRPQQIGDQLFRTLFSGPTRSLLDRSLGMIHGQQRGLRIKIHIDPEDHSLAQLASLPWEFLYRKETRDFLNLSRFTPILRYLDVQRPDTPLPLELPLRILVVISDPSDYPRLDLDRERGLIEDSWARQEDVKVEFIERATILALQDQLADQPYHVLHYMGHGGIDERMGRGVLVMEAEDGRGAIVDGNTLGILLRDIPTMRLAFLNACDTARVTKEKGLDPFAGVASAMVMAGIPAVVAMQFPVSDNAAITFSQKFYPLLARGEPVDAAVAEGRRAICLAESGTMEWGTPVLFLRAPDGIIFQVSDVQYVETYPAQIPEVQEFVDEELEAQLAELYTRGLSFFWVEDWDKAVRSFQAIVDVRSDYEDAADKLAAAEQQANLHALYSQAQAAQEDKNWAAALVALELLVAEAADFKDSAERLQSVRKQKQLTDLYDEAQHLHQAQQWQAVVNVFGQIHAIDPDYPDPEGLLPTAEREAAEQKRQEELNQQYSRAVREIDAGHWQEAQQLLIQVQEMEPGFREVDQLLARVEQEIEREKIARQRQEQVATSYEQALGLAQAQQWRQVLAKMDEIRSLDPEFADPEGLAVKAQAEIEKEEREALRQSELAALYAEAVKLLKGSQYQEALEKWGEVHARDAQYSDRQKVQATASKELEALARGAPTRRKLPRWVVAAIGVFALAAIVMGILLVTDVVQLPGRQLVTLPQTGGSTIQPAAIGSTESGIIGAVSFDFDQRSNGLSLNYGGDADTEVVIVGDTGEKAFRTGNGKALFSPDRNSTPDMYMQFQVDDDFIYRGSPTMQVQIEIEYLDEGTDKFSIQYDALRGGPFGNGQFKQSDEITKTGSGEFKTAVFTLSDAYFANRDHDSDFRIDDYADGAETVRRVTVSRLPPGTPQAPTPIPDKRLPPPVSEFLSNVEVLYHDHFDQLSSSEWGYDNNIVTASGGQVEIPPLDPTDPVGWYGFERNQHFLQEGEGVLLLFKYDDPKSEFFFALLNRLFESPDFREWGLWKTRDGFEFYTEKGTAGPYGQPLTGNLTPGQDTWYYLLLAVGEGGELVLQVWEQDDPSQISGYRESPYEDWDDEEWWFGILPREYEGFVYLDSFTEISFNKTEIPAIPNLYNDFENSAHAASSDQAWRHWDEDDPPEVSDRCSKCHSAEGLPTFLATGGETYPQPVSNGLTCETCHDDLTTFTIYPSKEVVFPSGAEVTFEDPTANLCLNCHQGRNSTPGLNTIIASANVGDDEVSEDFMFQNPHYFAAGATLFGTEVQGAYEYEGRAYNGRLTHIPGFTTCINCHDRHDLNVNSELCIQCHEISNMEDLQKIRMTLIDFDGDGDTSTGLAKEVQNVNKAILESIYAYAAEVIGVPIVYDDIVYPYWFIDINEDGITDPDDAKSENRYNAWTPRLLRAAYNYTWATKDPGSYAHNGQYILQILYDTLRDLGGDVSSMTRPEIVR